MLFPRFSMEYSMLFPCYSSCFRVFPRFSMEYSLLVPCYSMFFRVFPRFSMEYSLLLPCYSMFLFHVLPCCLVFTCAVLLYLLSGTEEHDVLMEMILTSKRSCVGHGRMVAWCIWGLNPKIFQFKGFHSRPIRSCFCGDQDVRGYLHKTVWPGCELEGFKWAFLNAFGSAKQAYYYKNSPSESSPFVWVQFFFS